jgi:beta-lactamase superfamily II metal-dependent hydrolase
VSNNGTTHVDILKLPHHGSIRNVGPSFFERIIADHYVISANGRFGNPESETLELIVAARKDDDFTIHLTYAGGAGDLAQRLETFVDTHRAADRKFRVSTRVDPALSERIDLGDAPPA